MQPIVEVAAERAAFDGVGQVPVRRRDDPGLANLRFVAADRLELTRLDDAKQVGLMLQSECVNFVQQNRAFACGSELAHFRGVGGW